MTLKEGEKIEGTLLTLLQEKAEKTNDSHWKGLYLCECGNQKLIRNTDVKTGKTKSCGCFKSCNSKIIKEGQEVPDSYLTLLKEKVEKTKDNMWMGLYQCKCGNQKLIRNTDVRQGKTKSCGCLREEYIKELRNDLTGKSFGKWTVLKRVPSEGKQKWLCRCECGVLKEVLQSNLINGRTKSCGCLRRELYYDDITGQKFGKLTALRPNWNVTKEKQQESVFWDCQCDCGNITVVSHHALKQLHTISCGCLISKGESRIKELLDILDIPYETQRSFSNLTGLNNGKLRFDFYLPTYNTVLEYQGEQHYKTVENWGGIEGLTARQENDKRKKDYCHKNNIKLIEILYTNFDSLNEEYLKRILDIK